MNPKKTLLLIVMLMLAFWAGAQDQSFTDCLVKTGSRWGAACEKCEAYKETYKRDFSGTYQIELKNACKEMIEVKVAVQEEKTITLFDSVFDSKDPEKYAKSFAVHSLAS